MENHGIRSFSGPVVWVGLVIAGAFIVSLGFAFITAIEAYLASLDRLAAVSPNQAIIQAGISMRILALVMGGLAVGTALYTFTSSREVVRFRQMPPPGTWVLGHPRVVVGERAILMARCGYGLAALLAVAGVVVAVLMWRFVDLMMSGIG